MTLKEPDGTGPPVSLSGEGLAPGTRLQEFRVERELGAGGFAITYLARDLSLGRPVAVKEYLPRDWGTRRAGGAVGPRTATASADYAWGLERFLEEARVLAQLNHRGIVRVYRIIETGGTAYIVMEHVDGYTLEEELRSSGPLPEARVRQLLKELAAGLAVVHAAGLLHRDIKPANVMLRKEDRSPVLIDFGAARQHIGRQSRSLTAVLTPGYAPPEQYYSKGRQGAWTDVYALGAVAYEALTGRVPDEAPGRAMADELPPVGDVATGPVSREMAEAVMAALETNPASRPQTVGEWRKMLGSGPAEGASRGGGSVGRLAAARPAGKAAAHAVGRKMRDGQVGRPANSQEFSRLGGCLFVVLFLVLPNVVTPIALLMRRRIGWPRAAAAYLIVDGLIKFAFAVSGGEVMWALSNFGVAVALLPTLAEARRERKLAKKLARQQLRGIDGR